MEACLDLIGPLTVSDGTMSELLVHARAADEPEVGPDDASPPSAERIAEMLRLVVSTPEYQMA